MTTIKIDKVSVTTSITNLEQLVETYRSATVSSIAQFSGLQNTLEGQAYTSLQSSINSALETQKTLVAECIVVTDNAKTFLEEISAAETAVSFG
ncbi:hypothetical protein [Streptococcus parauberis]|uniref:hypothetical protein n=1 Tax=Streptococcus parauberis TaxID=1348 RepID=UPI000CCF5FC2|nr:hypothetical protein [Streptococcus parauberis]PNY19772.1 hypothetical protein ASN86_00597 [Streptococcus parauberis]